jgi:hypothetical protein
MAENRDKRRHRKRISLKFGTEKAEKFGFTDDITHEGLFIRSAIVVKPGTTLNVEIDHPDGLIALIAEVRWAKKVPAYVINKMKGGMGLQIKSFLSGEDVYRSMCDELVLQRGD